MKSTRLNRFLATVRYASATSASVVILALTALPAHSASLTWDVLPGTVGGGNGVINGGAGSWDTTPSLGNWTTDGGATNVAWVNNAAPDSAVFQGTGGVVTQAGVLVNQITFSSLGYSITGGTLTLGGVSPKITTTGDAVISSALAGTTGMTKLGAGVLSLTAKATYTGNTIVNDGILSLDGGGGVSGTIRGAVDINSGATLRITTGDGTGYGTGTDVLSQINVNTGGTLNINTTANQTLGNAVINMTGGAIIGVATSNLDFFQGNSALNSLASPVTSTIDGARLGIRQTAGVTVNVAKGTTPSGIDLNINSAIASNSGFTAAPLIKTGAGTLRLNAINTFTGPTNVTAGTLILSNPASATTTDITVSGSANLRLLGPPKTVKSLTLNSGSTLGLTATKTGATTVTGALTANGTVTLKPEFLDLPTSSDVYTLATAASVAGTPTFTVDTSAFGPSRVAATAAIVGNELKLNIVTGGADLIWTNNAGTGNWNNNTDANFKNGASPDVFKTFDGVTFNGTAPGTIALVGELHPSVVNVSAASGNYTFTGAGSIVSGTLTKSGAGALTIANSNSHLVTVITGGVLNANAVAATGNGSTTVNGGTLNLGNIGGLGTGTLVLNSGSFDNTTGAVATLTNPQRWNGSFSFKGTNDLTTSGAIALTGNSQINVEAGSIISNGVISGAFNLTKIGAGSMQLNAANTYSGTTNVNGPGRLWVSNTLRNSSSFNAGPGSTLEFGATNIFVSGHGTAMPATRVITVNGGTLLFNAQADFRFGSVTLNDGATWTSNRPLTNYDALLANTDTGAATVTVGGTGTSVMNGTGGIHLQGVQNFVVGDTNAGPATDLRVDMILGNQGTIAGDPGGIHKTGAGTMVLNRVNTYIGATIVDEGRLIVGNASTITGSDVTVNGAAFQIDGINKTLNSLTVSAGSTLTLPALSEETTNILGDYIPTGAITLQPVFLDSPAAGDTYDLLSASSVGSGGTYTVDMSSRGATRVTATASVQASRFLVLTIGTGAADLKWSNSAGTGVWNLNADANFKNGAATDVFKTYDAVTFGNTAAGTVQLAGTLFPGLVTVDSTADYTFAGSGTLGSGTLVKSGSSTLNLTTVLSPNAVVLNAGTLNLVNAGGVGTGRLTLTGGVFNNGTGAPLTFPNVQTWNGGANFSGDALTITGPIAVAGDTDLTVGASGITISSPIDGLSGAVTKVGPGTLILNGATASSLVSGFNVLAGKAQVTTATGAANLMVGGGPDNAELVLDGNQNFNRVANFAAFKIGNKGTLTVSGVNALPNVAGAVTMTVEAGGVVQFVSGASPSTSETIASHHHVGDITLNGGTIRLPYSGTGTAYNNESVQLDGNVTVGGSTPSTIEFGVGATVENAGIGLLNTIPHVFTVADVTNSPAADLIVRAELENNDGGAGLITKVGPGTMLLADGIVHSYTGLTTVSEGTLAGTGSLAGPLLVEVDGTIAPGDSVGSFATGAATIAGTYVYDVNGAASDSLAVTGDLTLTGGTLKVSVLGGGATLGTYVIATYTGNRVGEFTVSGTLPTGYTVVYDDAAKRVVLTNGAGSSYADYIAQYPGASGAPGFGQDADADGIPNGVESVLGTDPSASTQGLTQVSSTPNSVTFRHSLSNSLPDDVTYRYEWSTNLVEWKASGVANTAGTVVTIVATTVVDNAAPDTDVVEVVATRTGTASSKVFVRLAVEK